MSTAMMPANGPAVGLFAVCAIVYVPTILSTSKPTDASRAPLIAIRWRTSICGNRMISHQKMIMSPATAIAIPSNLNTRCEPGRWSSPSAPRIWSVNDVPTTVRPSETTVPRPSPPSTNRLASRALKKFTCAGGRPHTPSIAPRRFPIQPSPASSTPTRPTTPTPRRLWIAFCTAWLIVVPRPSRHLLGDAVEEVLLESGMRVQDEAGDRGGEQHQREQREEAEVGDGGRVFVAVIALQAGPTPTPRAAARRAAP